uniref:TraC-like domain-containing protein n=1 Tax=candidate division CPR3 bacterium TaxID=2268181 RepID=A0A7C4RA89_UNCC3
MAEEEKNKKPSSTVEAAPSRKDSAQSYLDIDHFREGIVVMKDGSMRAVLSSSAVNFELKAEIERDSIIYAYQNFLNSLDFNIQVIIQSRRLDLENYLADLGKKMNDVSNELLKLQIRDYVDFINTVIAQANIMQKRFYVVIPHFPGGFKKIGAFGKIFSGSQAGVEVNDFAMEKRLLMQKVETTISGLQSVGVFALQLNTQELIELYYGAYNPEQATRQKLINIDQLEAEVIERADEMEI